MTGVGASGKSHASGDWADKREAISKMCAYPSAKAGIDLSRPHDLSGKAGRFGNFVVEIKPDAVASEISLTHAFRTFFTCTPRGGCPPSETIDLFGVAEDGPNLRYASVQLSGK